MRKALLMVLTVGGLVGAPATADAHYLTAGTATCTEASATYVEFNDNEKPISWQVSVDNVPLTSGTATFPGSSTTVTAPYPAPLTAGDHVVRWTSTWPGQGAMTGSFQQVVQGCPGPPAPPAPAAAPAPEAAPPAPAPQVLATPPVQQVAPSHAHRFRTRGRRTKPCAHGRRQLRDTRGRRFTVCRRRPAPVAVRVPKFTG